MSNPVLILKDKNSYGDTSLFQNGDTYQLNDGSSGSLVTLKFDNAAATTESLGPWHAIGAIRTQNGYEVAFANDKAELTVWYTDLNGNYRGGSVVFTAKSVMAYNLEQTFNYNFFPGEFGPNTTVIQTDTNAFGTLSLTLSFGRYLFSNSITDIELGGELRYGGSFATADSLGSWHAIGAALTATGYEVAFKNVATGQFTAWYTDGKGNYTGNTDVFSANSPALAQLETTFNQDLNGDGIIGLPSGTSLIQTDTNVFGSTSLLQVGNTYHLENADTGVGPELEFGNSAVTTDGLGSWHAVGAILTGSGYEVAFKNVATGQFTAWYTDGGGNYTGGTDVFSTNSQGFLALETTFNQDLNGNGKIGLSLVANHA